MCAASGAQLSSRQSARGIGWKPTSFKSRIALRQSLSNPPARLLGQITVPHEQRRETPFGDKGMVER